MVGVSDPWLGQVRSFAEYMALELPKWDDPFPEKPSDDIFVEGFNGYTGRDTRFRIGLELWLERHGFLYREALSCDHSFLNARMRAALQYFKEVLQPKPDAAIYLTEQVTPMYNELSTHFPGLQGSEYLPGTALGTIENGIMCQDVQSLTFEDRLFDFVLSFDVLEHVPDYHRAIREIYRVLKPGGILLFTVPISLGSPVSHIRARIDEHGNLIHILEEQYHGNPLGPPSLCFTSFGFDLVADLKRLGFSDSYALLYGSKELGYWGPPESLLVAIK